MSEYEVNCLLCGAPLHYEAQAQEMVCALCGDIKMSNAQCENGHFVCDACHEEGVASIVPPLCLQVDTSDPLLIANTIMRHPSVHMHGPEHHFIVGAALLTAYHNLTGKIDLPSALSEVIKRGSAVPGGSCGFWGACGAAIGAGIYMSVLTSATPLSTTPWKFSNELTARCLMKISEIGGPRCCKRSVYLCIQQAADFTEKQFGVRMPLQSDFRCEFYLKNDECLHIRCPFYPE